MMVVVLLLTRHRSTIFLVRSQDSSQRMQIGGLKELDRASAIMASQISVISPRVSGLAAICLVIRARQPTQVGPAGRLTKAPLAHVSVEKMSISTVGKRPARALRPVSLFVRSIV